MILIGSAERGNISPLEETPSPGFAQERADLRLSLIENRIRIRMIGVDSEWSGFLDRVLDFHHPGAIRAVLRRGEIKLA